MRAPRISTTDGTRHFDIPYDWLESGSLTPQVNDLEATAERSVTNGTLYRVRQAEIPQFKLKIAKSLTQAQIFPLLQIIREQKFKLTYFEKYLNGFKTIDVYCSKPEINVREYPADDQTDKILYEPFELNLIGYGGL